MNTLKKVLKTCKHQVPSCYLNKATELHHQLSSGIPFTALGGKRIHQYPHFIRFKIGRSWRMLYLITGKSLEPNCLISRQQLEITLKRRCKQC